MEAAGGAETVFSAEETAVEDTAPVMQSLWRFKPKPRAGRDRQRAKAPGGQRAKQTKARGDGSNRGGQKSRQQREGKSGGGRPARQMDPDSPFAALQKLKEQMKARE
ncbi:MAG TPA: hypothetical protein DDW95_11715 [Alphaproteobacteria bacterium]|nr:hypothetical protein [Alphaproteobacteria bacterium]